MHHEVRLPIMPNTPDIAFMGTYFDAAGRQLAG
jgi:hypothetical protein